MLTRTMVVTAMALVCGCATTPTVASRSPPPDPAAAVALVGSKAATDLSCSPDAIRVSMHQGLWVAAGCGWRQKYAVVCGTEAVARPNAPVDATDPAPRPTARPSSNDAAVIAPRRLCGYDSTRPRRAGWYPLPPALSEPTRVECDVDANGEVVACWVSNARGVLADELLELAYGARFAPLQRNGTPAGWRHWYEFVIETKTTRVVGVLPGPEGSWKAR